jgi:hypothetical protein
MQEVIKIMNTKKKQLSEEEIEEKVEATIGTTFSRPFLTMMSHNIPSKKTEKEIDRLREQVFEILDGRRNSTTLHVLTVCLVTTIANSSCLEVLQQIVTDEHSDVMVQ